MKLLRDTIRQILLEKSNIKLRGSSNYFGVTLKGIGFAQGPQVLRFKECQDDVDAIMQMPEYIEAEERFKADPKNVFGDGSPKSFRPRFYEIENAWITDPANRGKGHGKEIYRAFIEQAVEYSKSYGGVFIGPHRCVIGSGTSTDAQRVWKSLGREYTSSGEVIFIGL